MDIFEYEYKTDVSDLDIYSIQLKVHTINFNIHEYHFTAQFIDNQSTLTIIFKVS
jgi:hypothetical protein